MLKGMAVTSAGFKLGQKNTEMTHASVPSVHVKVKKRLDEDSKGTYTKRQDEAVQAEKRIPEKGNLTVSAAASDTQDPQVFEKEEISATPPSEHFVETFPESTTTLAKISEDFQTGLGSRPYSLILASCRSQKNAQKALDDFRSHGAYPLSLGKVKSGKRGIWWVVQTGCYRSKEEGERARKELKRPDAIVQKTPYCNLVGIFRSKIEMSEIHRRLERLGYYPYSIRDENAYRLLVGTHTTPESAEEQKLALEADGIQSRVVRR